LWKRRLEKTSEKAFLGSLPARHTQYPILMKNGKQKKQNKLKIKINKNND
jgi:hypothetical protein